MKRKLLSILLVFALLVQITPVYAIGIIAEEALDIVSISAEDVSVYEGTNGWYTQSWNYEEQKLSDYYFYYTTAPKQITVTYSDGSARTDSLDNWGADDVYFTYSPKDNAGQSYDNQWNVGKHQMTLSLNDIEASYDFEILPTIVESISVDGNTQIKTDYGYSTYPLGQFTITYKNGEVATFDSFWEVSETGYSAEFYGDTNDWDLGEHTMYAAYMGVITPYTVTIVENPVERIEIAPVTIVEGTHIATRYDWIDENEINYPAYHYIITDYTVFYKTGESQHITDGSAVEIYGQPYGWNITDDQSQTNKWGLGTHTAHADFFGLAETDFEVNIVESPVKNVIVDSLEYMEGENCWSCDEYDEYGNYLGNYLRYNIDPNEITVEYSDGSSYTGTIWELENRLNIEIIVDSDQSYNNQWGAGTHSATIKVEGKTFAYNVEITPSPIKSIAVDDVILYELNGGDYTSSFNFETGNFEDEYYCYSIPNYHYTVTLTNGRTIDGWANKPAIIDGVYLCPWIYINQSYENQWGVGEHTATMTLLGKSAEFKVTVLPCPIKKLTVGNISRIKNADGYTESEWIWDEETGETKEINPYFRYSWDMEYTATAELFDGSTVTAQPNYYPHDGGIGGAPLSFLVNGVILNVSFEDDQSYDNQWDIGKHTAKAICCGISCDFTVEVVSSPVKSIDIDKVTLIEGVDGFWNEDDFVFLFPEEGFPFSVILQDGTELKSFNKYGTYFINIGNKDYYIECDYPDTENWTVGNTYKIPASVCGKDFTIEVETVANPYKSLEIEDSGDLYLIFNKKDGTVDRQKVISFCCGMGDEGLVGGLLTTDKAQYHAEFCFDRAKKDVGYDLQCTDNVYLNIGELTSNTLEKTSWLALQLSYEQISQTVQLYRWYAKQTAKTFSGYDKTETQQNIDAIVTLAANICNYYYLEEMYIGEDGYDYGVFDADLVKDAVELLFGIKNIDLTKFSGYNASTGKVSVLYLTGGSESTSTLSYENEKWNIEYTDNATKDSLKITLNNDINIETIVFDDNTCAHDNTEIRGAKDATCCESGYTGDTYCKDCNIKIKTGTVTAATGKHTDADGKWETDGEKHWHTCYYDTTFDETEHSGGTATCKNKAICKDCGVEYGDFGKHKLTGHNRVEPTADKEGNIAYWTCDECGKYFSDVEGKTEIEAKDIVLEKLKVKKFTYLENEVTIEIPLTALPENCEITVKKIVPPPTNFVNKVKNAYDASSEVPAYFEIRMFDENGARIYTLDSEITIKYKLPTKYQAGYVLKINQEDSSGRLVEMETWREGEYICYKTDWLERV